MPSPQILAKTKYKETDYVEPVVEVEPELWDVIQFWERYRTQMIYAATGPVGLNMMVFLHELDRKKLPDALYDDYVSYLMFIEGESLKWIYFNQ